MCNVTIDAACDSGTLEKLGELVAKRSKALGETSSKATIATAINVFTSLKADTRKAPLVGNKNMYVLSQTHYVAGWARSGGHFRRVVREGGSVNWDITHHCNNFAGKAYVKGENVKVYKIQLLNENMNNTLYYVFANSERVARDYAEKTLLARMLKKESGMAKYAIGIAQAKASDRPMNAAGPSGSKAMKTAYDAAQIQFNTAGWDSGNVSLSFFDALNYSGLALKNGSNSLNLAMQKAANKTAGLIHVAFVNKKFSEDVQTPFPEVKRK